MRSRDLNGEQLATIEKKFAPMHDYLHRLRGRMARQGFAADDPLLARVVSADDAIAAICLELAALAIEHEVGPAERQSSSRAR